MNKMFLLLALVVSAIGSVWAQGEVPVNMYTGTPTIEVPLYTITAHDLSETIKLVYNSGGVKVSDVAGVVGLGWSLAPQFSVVREVRGLPDDFRGVGTDARRGWCFVGGGANAVHNMPNSADLSASTCSDEQADHTLLHSFNGLVDTEPDIYHYSIGQLSGKFVLDKNLVVRMIPFVNVTILPAIPDETNDKLSSFVIITNDGYRYTFDQAVTQTKWTKKVAGVDNVDFLKHQFDLYDSARHGAKVSYTSEWKISKIESPDGAEVFFQYELGTKIDASDTAKVALRKSSVSSFDIKNVYVTRTEGYSRNLSYISTSTGTEVRFSYEDRATLTTMSVSDERRGSAKTFRYFNFKYEEVKSLRSSYGRKFLMAVSEHFGCDKLPPYTFSYVGVKDPKFGLPSIDLPEPSSKSVDFWGYYSGKANTTLIPKLYVYPELPPRERYRLYPIPGYAGQVITLDGADRTPGSYSAKIGTLEVIGYPWGGSTTLNFEPHTYFDETSGQTYFGGGLRIRSATYFDGLNPQANISKTFTYEESPGKSSGRQISRPTFAIPVWEYRDPSNPSQKKSYATLSAEGAQSLWEHLTARTTVSLSPAETTHGSPVGYKVVKVSRYGSGSALFEFLLPGVYVEQANGDWAPTLNKFARSSACPGMGVVNEGGAWSYPYSPNHDYEHERGLLYRKQEFNEAGKKVREIVNTYQYLYKEGTTPMKVWGLFYDKYANSADDIYFFGKYGLLTDVAKVPASERVTLYDESNNSRSVADLTEYLYESSYHRLLTKVKKTNSDGTLHSTETRYPLDYGVVPSGADKASEMIGWMQGNFRNGVPIEQITRMQKSGDTEKVIKGSIVTFDNFGTTRIFPKSTLSLALAAPTGTFTTSYIDAATKKFVRDPAYEVVATNLAFGDYGKPLSEKGIRPEIVSTHWGYAKTLPVAIAKHAAHDQFVFSDFETTTGFEFEQSSNVYGTGRTGVNALYPQVQLKKKLKKADVQNYVLSFWFKKASGSVDFRLVIKNNSNTVISDITFPVNATSAEFAYVRKVVPAAAFPSEFAIELQAQLTGTLPGSHPDLLPMIDDVAFYPEGAEISYFTYAIPFGVSSVTDMRGKTSYTTYDDLGRIKYTLDHNKNIVSRNTYSFAAQPVEMSSDILLPAKLWAATDLTFKVTNDCIEGETYEWDFGDGFVSTGTVPAINRIFYYPGEYTVTARVTHSDHGQKVDTESFTIIPPPVQVSLCAKGVYEFSNCGQSVVSSYSCSSITATPNVLGTIFRASIDSDEVVIYRWYKRNIGDAQWFMVSEGSNQYEGRLSSPYRSYVVKCIVETVDKRKFESEEYAVFVTNCN